MFVFWGGPNAESFAASEVAERFRVLRCYYGSVKGPGCPHDKDPHEL